MTSYSNKTSIWTYSLIYTHVIFISIQTSPFITTITQLSEYYTTPAFSCGAQPRYPHSLNTQSSLRIITVVAS